MNTKQKWLPRKEWARREVAKIDADLTTSRAYEPNWRRYRNAERGRERMRKRRDRLAKVAGMDFIPDEECGPF